MRSGVFLCVVVATNGKKLRGDKGHCKVTEEDINIKGV